MPRTRRTFLTAAIAVATTGCLGVFGDGTTNTDGGSGAADDGLGDSGRPTRTTAPSETGTPAPDASVPPDSYRAWLPRPGAVTGADSFNFGYTDLALLRDTDLADGTDWRTTVAERYTVGDTVLVSGGEIRTHLVTDPFAVATGVTTDVTGRLSDAARREYRGYDVFVVGPERAVAVADDTVVVAGDTDGFDARTALERLVDVAVGDRDRLGTGDEGAASLLLDRFAGDPFVEAFSTGIRDMDGLRSVMGAGSSATPTDASARVTVVRIVPRKPTDEQLSRFEAAVTEDFGLSNTAVTVTEREAVVTGVATSYELEV